MRKTLVALAALAASSLVGCEAVVVLLAIEVFHNHHETADYSLTNVPDDFSRQASHHGFEGTETHFWRNCGETATVDVDENEPGCYSEGADVTITIEDAEGATVFLGTFGNHRRTHHRDPIATAPGQPGVWKITLTFQAENRDRRGHDASSFHELSIRILRLGPCVHDLTVSHGNNGVGNGVDPQPPGYPPVNDPTGTAPGTPGNRGGPFVRWTSTHTNDRTVTESYTVPISVPSANVYASWDTLTEGSFHVTVQDAEGATVYDSVFSPGDTPPLTVPTASGAPGIWTVTFAASQLTSTGLQVIVYEP